MKKDGKASEIVENLTKSAFEYFAQSAAQLKENPKLAVVAFYTGVELIFKIRLAAEHWSLIVDKSDAPSWAGFISGDFQSVSIKKANERINSVCQDGLQKNSPSYEAFERLRKHRNLIVHFYHDLTKHNAEQHRAIEELLTCWYHMSHILKGQWSEQFKKSAKDIDDFSDSIHNFRQYLSVKYSKLKPEIEALKKRNIELVNCPSCDFRTLHSDKGNGNVIGLYSCLICNLRNHKYAEHTCDCGKKLVLEAGSSAECLKCGVRHEFSSVIQSYENAIAPGDVAETRAHCGECNGYQSLIKIADEDTWICHDCGDQCETSDLGQCDYCGDLNSNLPEFSSLEGCHACEGPSLPD